MNDLEQAAKDSEATTAMDLEAQAQQHADDIRALGGVTAAGWDSAFWTNYGGDQSVLLRSIRLGRSVELNLLAGERGIHGMPAVVPFLAAQGALLILRDADTEPHARALMQSIMLRTVLAMPGDIRYTLISGETGDGAFPLRDVLPRIRVAPPGQTVADQLGVIEGEIYRITTDLAGRGRLVDQKREDRQGEQFELIAALDFPDAFTREPGALELLVKVANRGPVAGRHLVLEVRADKPLPDGFDLTRFENAQIVDLRAGQAAIVVDKPLDREAERRLVKTALKTATPARNDDFGDLAHLTGALVGASGRRDATSGGEPFPAWFDSLDTPLADDMTPHVPGAQQADKDKNNAPSATAVMKADATAPFPTDSGAREGAMLADNPYVLIWSKLPPSADMLEKVARTPENENGFGIPSWAAAEKPVPLWLGRKFDAYGHALAVLRRVPNNHLLVVGSQAGARLAALSSALAALAAMLPAAGVELDIIDAVAQGQPGEGMLATGAAPLLARGSKVRHSRPEQVAAVLERLAGDVKRRHLGPGARRSILLILSQPDRIPALHVARSGKGPVPKGAPTDLREILQRGSEVGVHVILTASSVATVGSILNPKSELLPFGHRAGQEMNEDDSMTLFSSLVGARIAARSGHPAAMLLADLALGADMATLFRGYGTGRAPNAKPTLQELEIQLRALFG